MNGKDAKDNPINNGTSENLAQVARYQKNGGYYNGAVPANTCTAEYGTAKVGSYAPNAWGLYDMLGNVYEWCLDWWQEKAEQLADPLKGPTSGTTRVERGGGFNCTATMARSAWRHNDKPDVRSNHIGIRLVCSADGQ